MWRNGDQLFKGKYKSGATPQMSPQLDSRNNETSKDNKGAKIAKKSHFYSSLKEKKGDFEDLKESNLLFSEKKQKDIEIEGEEDFKVFHGQIQFKNIALKKQMLRNDDNRFYNDYQILEVNYLDLTNNSSFKGHGERLIRNSLQMFE